MADSLTGFTAPGAPPSGPKLASTVMLLRDLPSGGIEVFLVKRSGKSSFMGGAYVFPGGKVDADDGSAEIEAAVLPETLTQAAARLGDRRAALSLGVAAVREVLEEAGVLLGRGPGRQAPEPATIRAAREALNDRQARFSDLAKGAAWELDLSLLEPWSHWITPSREPKRFDTRFYVARAPAEQQASSDRYETTDAVWLSPSVALERHAALEIFLPPPTLVNLLELAPHPSVDAVMSAARLKPIAPILPKLGMDGPHLAILLPWAPEYASTEGEGEAAADHPARGDIDRVVLEGERWIARSHGVGTATGIR